MPSGDYVKQKRRLNTILGENVRALRESLELTQEGLGADCDMTGRAVYAVERGERFPHQKNLERLAERLKTTVPALLTEYNGEAPELIAHVTVDLFDAIAALRDKKQEGLLYKLSQLTKFGVVEAYVDEALKVQARASMDRNAPSGKNKKTRTA